MNRIQAFTITQDDDGIRLDRWFKRHYPGVSFGELQKACRKGLIRLDGKKAKTEDRIASGQEMQVKFLELDAQRKPAAPFSLTDTQITETQGWVLGKTGQYIALNKPAGLAVQGGSGVKDHLDRRMEALRFGREDNPKLVHRLDKDTSGVLLLGRSAKDASILSDAFRSRKTEKTYLALCVGVPEIRAGEIEGALVKGSTSGQEKMQVTEEQGKRAVTDYEVIDHAHDTISLVRLRPITGRTHQLRVHMAEMGHPILGDGKYGGKAAFLDGLDLPKQLHLHAHHIRIQDIFNTDIDITAPLPTHMKRSMKELGLSL